MNACIHGQTHSSVLTAPTPLALYQSSIEHPRPNVLLVAQFLTQHSSSHAAKHCPEPSLRSFFSLFFFSFFASTQARNVAPLAFYPGVAVANMVLSSCVLGFNIYGTAVILLQKVAAFLDVSHHSTAQHSTTIRRLVYIICCCCCCFCSC